ncbi:hypothetical protein [Pseudarthrobacter sp. CC12]|uniref:hypothetical protein n=1 Tax=Pseudarthrobacter sp. CC12 TaxID=3029193 RepID=UPI0032652877
MASEHAFSRDFHSLMVAGVLTSGPQAVEGIIYRCGIARSDLPRALKLFEILNVLSTHLFPFWSH